MSAQPDLFDGPDLADGMPPFPIRRPIPPRRPVNTTAAILRAVATDRVHAGDAAMVRAAILDQCRAAGVVSANSVRRYLYGPAGCAVYPKVIGAVFSGLVAEGVLVADGWTINSDRRGGNAGKPLRRYRCRGCPTTDSSIPTGRPAA